MAAGIVLSDRQRLDWLRLIRSDGIGPRSFRSLTNRFGGAGPALEALPDLARQAGRDIRICPPAEAEREMIGLIRLGGRFIALGDAGCKVSFALDFDYAGRLGGAALKLGFQGLAGRMVDDFCKEAERAYG